MIRQISIFAENKKGSLSTLTGILKDENINIEAMIINDSGEYGIIRMLVDDPERTYDILKGKGYLVHVDSVYAVDMQDTPGSLNGLLSDISAAGVNVDYVYISFSRSKANPIAVFHTEVADGLEESLTWKGYKLL
ncbi:MAG: ACT domain-containing protein [Lachnospiraceae bacterium]|jgi:hypothetical protein|nr:ACT domain-containing protein [Lachnospiraceae bacterium]MCI1397265.1 ACT domain-containing protein [Lachnospiraceae bacterium]MCI1423340.1 ACT domain-containing protein [Lachnospiraceae bacterium]MCI1452127.1 ACT domain-containing protein [Lachnospiraceae bacterium]